MTTGQEIRARRRALGMTLKDLAALAKCALPVLAAIEKDRVVPTPDVRERIAEALGEDGRSIVWTKEAAK